MFCRYFVRQNPIDMKMIALVMLFISVNSFGQWKSYIISPRGDTLNRVDMDGKKQGPWVIHVDQLRGEPGYDEQGYFEDDVKDGRWVKFALSGDKIAEENYYKKILDFKYNNAKDMEKGA